MSESLSASLETNENKPRWQPLSAIDRRVLGVLAEKAKTTPDHYPLSINAIRTASNQKSNRTPLMNLEVDDLEESVERLRELGAVGMIEGYGRVTKYRHYLYEWLGIDKVELAVMAELLLRGAQTEGELRGRAARMEPIADLSALRPILASLKAKKLVLPLTPEGRGHAVTHALYAERELEKIKAKYATARPSSPSSSVTASPRTPTPPREEPSVSANSNGTQMAMQEVVREITDIRGQVGQLRSDMEELSQKLENMVDELHEMKSM